MTKIGKRLQPSRKYANFTIKPIFNLLNDSKVNIEKEIRKIFPSLHRVSKYGLFSSYTLGLICVKLEESGPVCYDNNHKAENFIAVSQNV